MARMGNDEQVQLRAACVDQVLRLIHPLRAPRTGEMASGVAIRIERCHFIATVAHFLRDIEEIEIVRTAIQRNIKGDFKNVIYSSALDIGLIELTEDQASDLVAFACEESILPDAELPADTHLIVGGFPDATCLYLPPFTVSNALTYDAAPVSPAEWPDNLGNPPSEDKDILLKLSPKMETRLYAPSMPPSGISIQATEPPRPRGMSGGGLWLPVWERESVCYPRVQLVGIQRSFYEGPRLLRGIQIKHWLEFVADNYPELAEPIDQVLARSMDLRPPENLT